MKKIGFIALLFIAFVCLNSCESNTPTEDTTKLWPAQNDTSELWGYINEKGKMVIPPQFKEAFFFCGGKAKVILENYQHAFINKYGKVIHVFPEGEHCDGYFYYGTCRFYDYLWTPPSVGLYKAGPYGMLDSHFNVIIPKEYTYLGIMGKEGMVSSNEGFLNKKGEIVLKPQYRVVSSFYDGIAIVESNTGVPLNQVMSIYKYGAINTEGVLVIDTIYADLEHVGEHRIAYRLSLDDDRLWGLMDTQGRIITDPIYVTKDFFGDGGLMPVQTDYDHVHYIDQNGKIQFSGPWGIAEPFSNGVAWVKEYIPTVYMRLINMNGETLFTLPQDQYPEMVYHNGLCLIHERKYDKPNYDEIRKYINKKGEVVYSWVYFHETYKSPKSAPRKAKLSEDEMMLKHFEGTEYYPLAEQCAKRMRERENIKNN